MNKKQLAILTGRKIKRNPDKQVYPERVWGISPLKAAYAAYLRYRGAKFIPLHLFFRSSDNVSSR